MAMRGLLLVLVALACYARTAVAVDQVSVYYNAATKAYTIESGYDEKAVAAGSFDDQLDENGWTFLKIVSNESYTAEEQYFASGMVEGYLTAEQLDFYGVNQFEDWGFTQDTTPPALAKWMEDNLAYMRAGPPPNRANADKLDDSIWVEVALIVQQVDGIVDGYNRAKSAGRSRMREVWTANDIWMLIMAGDMEDLVPLFKGQIPHYDDPTMMDCSAIVRLTPASAGPQDLIVAHNTWRSFMIMNRVYKKLTINGITTAFSSSPCFISSKDDFYITHYDLAIYETTNNIFNTSLYDLLTPKSLLTSVRNVVADRGAANGQEWTDIFGRYNSGTYNNQFGVIDMKLFSTFLSQPEKDENGHSRKLVANTFWIIEQIPGYTHAADVTYQLNLNGFWPSYNIPFFKDIYEISGYLPKAAASPIDYSYTESFRALLFDRLAPKTDSFEDIQWLIRYNEWKNDAASVGDPAKSLASRYDLRPDGFAKKAAAFGAVDAKVTSYRRLFGSSGTEQSTFGAAIVSGPTAQDNAMTPPFRWDNPKWVNISHAGLPIVWDFDWVDVEKVSIFQ